MKCTSSLRGLSIKSSLRSGRNHVAAARHAGSKNCRRPAQNAMRRTPIRSAEAGLVHTARNSRCHPMSKPQRESALWRGHVLSHSYCSGLLFPSLPAWRTLFYDAANAPITPEQAWDDAAAAAGAEAVAEGGAGAASG